MRIDAWEKRLKAAYDGLTATASKRPLLRRVAGAISFAAAASEPARLTENTAFVAPAGDVASDNAVPGEPVVSRRVLVVLALRDASDSAGADGLTDLERAIEATVAALIGWRPEGALGQATYEDGSLLAFEGKSIWWQLRFSAPVAMSGES